MLPGATKDQILATAFNRLHQQESEGGSVEEEYRVEYVADRVQTYATAFLGLTFECARCHDHKYDPISQKEYYGLFAMFQNIDEAGLYSFFTPAVPTPALMLLDEAGDKKMAGLKARVTALEKELEGLRRKVPPTEGELAWLADERARFDFETLEGGKLTNLIEAKAIEAAGIDIIIAQGIEAGGHRGIFNQTFDAAFPS